MSVNIWEMYFRCPVCREISTFYDYHENTSSDNTEIFCVLNAGKQSNHIWLGNPMNEPVFICPYCKNETKYDLMFTEGSCRVEDLERYKTALRKRMRWADKYGRVSFSDWDPDWSEEPALSRLISMYPSDNELRRIKDAYRLLHIYGKRAIAKQEINEEIVSRELILVPEALERVYLGNSVKRISAHAFENCEALDDIFIPDSVTSIGEYAFSKSNLHKIHVSGNITHIGKRAFFHMWLNKFFFPDEIKEIGEECFAECPYLNDLWIPPNVRIGRNAFAGCDNLRLIQISTAIQNDVIATWGLSENCNIERYEA